MKKRLTLIVLSAMTITASAQCPDDRHPHIIDLGLSVRWACCNVGASSPEQYGNYYSWGETETKSVYTWDNYSHLTGEKGHRCKNLGDISGTQYDAARVHWGKDWRMPNADQADELDKLCTKEWEIINGIAGQKVIGPNGKWIFLPAGGCEWTKGNNHIGVEANLWISRQHNHRYSYDPPMDHDLFYMSDYIHAVQGNIVYRYSHDSYIGMNIRPVTNLKEKNSQYISTDPSTKKGDSSDSGSSSGKGSGDSSGSKGGSGSSKGGSGSSQKSGGGSGSVITGSGQKGIVFQSKGGDKLYYKILSQNTCELTGAVRGSYQGIVDIPGTVTYNGVKYTVTKVGRQAFANQKAITSVTVPASVTAIEDRAFDHCTKMTTLRVQGKLTYFGKGVTAYCSSLTKITFDKPDKFVAIGNCVYNKPGKILLAGCHTASMAKNDGLVIEEMAFAGMPIKKIIFTNEGINIKKDAFRDCTQLVEAEIKSKKYSCSVAAFEGCSNMKKLRIAVLKKSDIGKRLTGTPAVLDVLQVTKDPEPGNGKK